MQTPKQLDPAVVRLIDALARAQAKEDHERENREVPIMTEQMPEMTRDFLEVESLRVAKQALGCKNLQAVRIACVEPPGSGPNWYPEEFVPPLPPIAEKEARLKIASLTGTYALQRE